MMQDEALAAVAYALCAVVVLGVWFATSFAWAQRFRHLARAAAAVIMLTPAVIATHGSEIAVPAWWIVYLAGVLPDWRSCVEAVLIFVAVLSVSRWRESVRLAGGRTPLRFNLKMLFVLVTALCVVAGYVTYQWRIVQERNAVQAWLDKQDYVVNDKSLYIGDNPLLSSTRQQIPWLRRMLGDQPLKDVYHLPKDEAERQRVVSAFPNEQIFTWPKRTPSY